MSQTMSWVILIIAGLLEAVWAVGLKYTEGFTRLWPSVFVALAIVVSMGLLGVAARNLPISTAYPAWVGIGVVGAVTWGVVVFREPATPLRMFFIVMLLVSLIGLEMSSKSP